MSKELEKSSGSKSAPIPKNKMSENNQKQMIDFMCENHEQMLAMMPESAEKDEMKKMMDDPMMKSLFGNKELMKNMMSMMPTPQNMPQNFDINAAKKKLKKKK